MRWLIATLTSLEPQNLKSHSTSHEKPEKKAKRKKAKVKSKTVFYVCSFSTNIFLLVFEPYTKLSLSLSLRLSLCLCVWESEVYEQWGGKKSSQALGRFEKNCATIADKTNTFVASQRNVHKARFGRNVKIFVKMPTPYNRPGSMRESRLGPTRDETRREGQGGRRSRDLFACQCNSNSNNNSDGDG